MKPLTPVEAVYGFAAWLSGRDKVLIVSRNSEAAEIAALASQFCQVNNLSGLSKDWPKNLIFPLEKP
jgi:hypothetical protein